MSNPNKYYIFSAANNICVLFSTGAIIQSFLKFKGLDPVQIGYFISCISILQVVSMFFSVFFSDRVRSVPQAMAFLFLPTALFFFVMLVICLSRGMDAETVYPLAMLGCIVSNLFIGLRNVLSYKLPYYIIAIEEYPKILNTAGILLNILGTGASLLFSFLIRVFDYERVISLCFVFSVLCVGIGFFSLIHLPKRCDYAVRSRKISLSVFKIHSFRYLAPSDFLRGISAGIIGMTAVIMLSTVTADTSLSSALSVISAAAGAAACYLYFRIYKKIKTLSLCLIGGAVVCASMLCMLAGRNTGIFVSMYFLVYFGMTFVDYTIPIYATQIVPFEEIGGYTALRMLLTTAGTAVGNMVAGHLSATHPFLLLAIGGVLELYLVISYFFYDRVIRPRALAKKTLEAGEAK